MILIPKARYRVFPLHEDCHHRTFRFFILQSILYSPDVFLFLSFALFYLRLSPHSSSYRAPVKPLTFPFFTSRKEEESRRQNITVVRSILRFHASVFDDSLPRSSEFFSCTYFSHRTDNKKYIHAKLIRYLYSHSSSLNVFCSHEIVLTSHDHQIMRWFHPKLEWGANDII